jgi:hypothetical protein
VKKIVFVTSVLALSACSTMQPPRYAVSVDNIQELKKHDGAQAQVIMLNQPTSYDVNCRLMGPIEPADGLSYSQFITKAFNDEFKMAEIYDTTGTTISGDITHIQFSSVSGLTSGYWDIGLKLSSSNGASMTVNNRYDFKSGFDAITACNATADALTPAVQDLIKATISNSEFSSLLN